MIPALSHQHPMFPTEIPSLQTPLAIPIPEKALQSEPPAFPSGKQKKRPPSLLVNERVRAILSALYEGRYFTTPQLQALFWRRSDGSLPTSLRATQQKLHHMSEARLIRAVKMRVREGEGDL